MEILTHVNFNYFYYMIVNQLFGGANAKIFGASRHFIAYIYSLSLCSVANRAKNDVFAGVLSVPPCMVVRGGCQG